MHVLFQACYAVLQSWVSKKFMTGWYSVWLWKVFTVTIFFPPLINLYRSVVLFPVAVTFFITWWFIQFVDGFFSPIYERLGIDIFGKSFGHDTFLA